MGFDLDKFSKDAKHLSAMKWPFILNKISVYTGIALVLTVLTWVSVFTPNKPDQLGEAGWEYAWGNDDGAGIADTWKSLDRFPQTVEGRNGRSWLFLRTSLPETVGERDALWIGRTFFDYEVYIDDELVASRGMKDGNPDRFFPGFRWQFIDVGSSPAGQRLLLKCFSDGFYIGPVQPVYLDSKLNILSYMFRTELLPFGTAVFFLIVGILIVILSLANKEIVGALYIGLLMIITAIYTVRFLEIRFFILDMPYFWDFLGVYVTLFYTYLFAVLFDRLFHLRYSKIFRLNVAISIAFLVGLAVILVLTIVGRIWRILPDMTNLGIGLRTFHQYHILVSFLLMLFLMFKQVKAGNPYALDLSIGLVFFFIFALPSVLHAFGIGMTVLPKTIDVGMVFFLGTVVYVTSIKYYETYKAFKSYMLSSVDVKGNNVVISNRSQELEILGQYSFTKREIEVIQKSLQGKRNKEIASELGITERTIKQHLTNIFEKADVSSKLELFHEITRQNLTAD